MNREFSSAPKIFALFVAVAAVFSVFSYSLTDPNLVLSSWQPYWQFQLWMWQNLGANHQLLASMYAAIILIWFGLYFFLLSILRQQYGRVTIRKEHIIAFSIVIIVLSISYNALSHDVFNYIFNAKLVAVYNQDPHVVTAIEYPNDLWTRFMHNIHTPAPYGYGWTALSLIPYFLGMGKFLITWLSFRFFQIISLVLLYITLQKLSQSVFKRTLYISELAILFLNPLFLTEVVSSMHNDLWMMVPALFSIYILLTKKNLLNTLLSLGLLAASFTIKYATVALLPLYILILAERTLLKKYIQRIIPAVPLKAKVTNWVQTLTERFFVQYIPLIASIAMFLPLFSARSQYFHPWYLLWSLCWLPLIKVGWWVRLLVLFSLSSLLRYIPWMLEGGFAENTLLWQQLITWGLPLIVVLILNVMGKNKASRRLSQSLYNE